MLLSNSEKGKHIAESSDSETEDYHRKDKRYEDNSSGSETTESLRLMPLELRDPLLASDYLKLPSLK